MDDTQERPSQSAEIHFIELGGEISTVQDQAPPKPGPSWWRLVYGGEKILGQQNTSKTLAVTVKLMGGGQLVRLQWRKEIS